MNSNNGFLYFCVSNKRNVLCPAQPVRLLLGWLWLNVKFTSIWEHFAFWRSSGFYSFLLLRNAGGGAKSTWQNPIW